MPYDEFLADRVRNILKEKHVLFLEKKMMGGLCIMVDDKMLCGVLFDKKGNTDLFMARIGEEAVEKAMKKNGAHLVDFSSRPMKNYVFVSPEGFDLDEDLEEWIQLCLDFNPFAKASKKRKKKE